MTLKLFEMVDRLQTFGSITNVLDRFSKRQGGRTKDTLKAGPAPTPPPPHRSIIEYIFYYHYMYIRNVSISEMSSGRVKMVGSSGRAKSRFFGEPDTDSNKNVHVGSGQNVWSSGRSGRVVSDRVAICDPRTSEMTAEGQCVFGKTALLHYWRVVMSLSIL